MIWKLNKYIKIVLKNSFDGFGYMFGRKSFGVDFGFMDGFCQFTHYFFHHRGNRGHRGKWDKIF